MTKVTKAKQSKTAKRHARANKRSAMRPAKAVHHVALPKEGVLRVVAHPSTFPVVMPSNKAGVIEIVPVKRTARSSWWHRLFGASEVPAK